VVDETGGAALEARIVRLERAERRMRFATVIGAAVVALAVLTAETSAGPNIVGDPQGAHLELSASGITIYGSSAVVRAFLGVRSNGQTTFTVYDTSARPRAALQVGSNGTPGLSIYNSDGKFAVEVNDGNAGGFARFSNAAGLQRATAGVYSDGTGGFAAYGGDGTGNAIWHGP
jgi:hypothetical protein